MTNSDKQVRLSGSEGKSYAKQNLVQIKIDHVNWKVLWRNPKTGELWSELFPHAEMHGGGPSEFVRITEAQAKAEFGSVDPEP